MNKLILPALAATAAFAAPARAELIADFELNGTLTNAVGGPVTLANDRGLLGDSGITFGAKNGPSISGLGALAAYTIDIGFTLDTLAGYSGSSYLKLIDFSGLARDAGFYSYNGLLAAYPLPNSTAPVFAAGTPVRLTLSRDVAGLISAYVDGAQVYTQADPTNRSGTIVDGLDPLTFFTDDRATSGVEATSGFVDYIRIADTAVTPGEITPPPSAVPEPSAWALLISGFGLIGAVLRRRRVAPFARA